MRSLPIRNVAGQVNMKGKLHMPLNCGCCELQNLKPKYEKNRHLKEMRSYYGDDLDSTMI